MALWGLGALVGGVLLVGLVLVTVGGSAQGSRPALIGTLLLLGVIELALAAKAIEAIIDWRERGA